MMELWTYGWILYGRNTLNDEDMNDVVKMNERYDIGKCTFLIFMAAIFINGKIPSIIQKKK